MIEERAGSFPDTKGTLPKDASKPSKGSSFLTPWDVAPLCRQPFKGIIIGLLPKSLNPLMLTVLSVLNRDYSGGY